MARSLPISFKIFEGDDMIREEILDRDVIKVGKIESSHLKLLEDSVSRMHAVIEVNGVGDICLLDLGAVHGTWVNGQRVNKALLTSGDVVYFGDCRVVVTFPVAMPEKKSEETVTPIETPSPSKESDVELYTLRLTGREISMICFCCGIGVSTKSFGPEGVSTIRSIIEKTNRVLFDEDPNSR